MNRNECGLLLLKKIIDEMYIVKIQIIEKLIFDTTNLEIYTIELYDFLLYQSEIQIPLNQRKLTKDNIKFPKKIHFPDIKNLSPSKRIEILREYEETYKISTRKIYFFNTSLEILRVIKKLYPNCHGELLNFICKLKFN